MALGYLGAFRKFWNISGFLKIFGIFRDFWRDFCGKNWEFPDRFLEHFLGYFFLGLARTDNNWSLRFPRGRTRFHYIYPVPAVQKVGTGQRGLSRRNSNRVGLGEGERTKETLPSFPSPSPPLLWWLDWSRWKFVVVPAYPGAYFCE